jgi:hypothetical protein
MTVLTTKPEHPDYFAQALSIVEGDRRADYGHPLDNFQQIAGLWSAYLGQPITAEDVAWMMVLTKIARQKHAHKADNIIDAAGYIACVQAMDHRLRDEGHESGIESLRANHV